MKSHRHTLRSVRVGFACLAGVALSRATSTYDPLEVPRNARVVTLDLPVRDSVRHREIPVRIYLPPGTASVPVILFSHGLGGSREGSTYLGHHWAARGYLVVYLQHPGSDAAVWQDLPAAARLAALTRAANLENFVLRVQDVRAVLDQLEAWNRQPGHPLSGRLDLKHIGMSGHSFGAVTTEAVSGERFLLSGQRYTDPRIRAAIAFSPSAPREGLDPAAAFGSVTIPWMLMTGTRDVSPIGETDAASRLLVFPALPAGGKYQVVLDGAEHSAFTDGALPADQGRRNPNHHRVILALSTAFWDSWLRGDAAARRWLDGDGPRSVMETKDGWERK